MAGINDMAQGAISGQWTVSAMGLWLFHCLMPPLVSSTHPGFSTKFRKRKEGSGGQLQEVQVASFCQMCIYDRLVCAFSY